MELIPIWAGSGGGRWTMGGAPERWRDMGVDYVMIVGVEEGRMTNMEYTVSLCHESIHLHPSPSDSMQSPSHSTPITIEFRGGMDILFSSQSTHPVHLPWPSPNTQPDIRFLIRYIKDHLLSNKDRPDLFVQADSVRPGILVLINDTDWELEGELDYKIQQGDSIMFISSGQKHALFNLTLHTNPYTQLYMADEHLPPSPTMS